MANRPWVIPNDIKEYTESKEVADRSIKKLEIDIQRAECEVIAYTKCDFSDSNKYPTIPESVKTATIIIAEAFANNAIGKLKEVMSETFDDYSYTKKSNVIDLESLGISTLLFPYVEKKDKGIKLRMRKL